jgi:hypothetical protein
MHYLMLSALYLVTVLGSGDEKNSTKDAVEDFRTEITARLANLDCVDVTDKQADAKKKKELESLRRDIYQIVDRYSVKLRPLAGSKKYVSKDRRFVLVIGANGDNINTTKGEQADASDPQATLVVAIGGDGSPGLTKNGGAGGQAAAKAAKGVALAIGGRGGMAQGLNQGGGGFGGGGGGSSHAGGSVGSISLGGPGGKGFNNGGNGGHGGGNDIVQPRAIRDAMKKM